MRMILIALWGGVLALGAPAYGADLKVRARIVGIEQETLATEMLAVSSIHQSTVSFATLAPLRRAATRDAENIQNAMVSLGYYAATVTPRLSRSELDVEVHFDVVPGKKFTVSAAIIEYDTASDGDRPTDFGQIGQSGPIAPTGDAFGKLETSLLTHLRNNGYPAAVSRGRYVDADFETGTAIAVFPVTSGPRATYGDIKIIGKEKTSRNHIRALRPFESGELVSRAALDIYRDALADTGLFSEVSVEPGAPEDSGVTPIVVTVTERKRRTLGAGVTFGTDVGVGTTAFWENRNFRGGGDTVSARIAVSAPAQEAALTYQKPVPRLPGSWNLETILRNEDTDAFNAQTFKIGAGITQHIERFDLQASAKIQYTGSTIVNNDGTEETFSSAAFPLSVVYNSENSTLNPTRGYSAQVAVTPYLGTTSFTKLELGGAARTDFGTEDRLILAGRAFVGASFIGDDATVPATERFFAGGGGSVRGYGYQMAGPLDEDGDPQGGASTVELNLETRFSVTESLQLVTFVDGGTVFEDASPSFSEDILFGTGVGVRYFTPVGPIRFDIATPVDRREIVDVVDGEETVVFEDDPVQVYIGLGQPF